MNSEKAEKRVRSVLLAGTPYDAFLLEQAGFKRHQDTKSEAPVFDLVRSGADALNFCASNKPDLIIADFALSDMTAFDLGAKLKENYPNIPLMVVTSRSDLGGIAANAPNRQYAHGVFIWYGDPEVLRTLVRLYEDECNAATLLASGRALAIMLVEDEPNFYSHYLPMLYTQIRKATLELMPDESRHLSPWSTIKSRPLVLLRQNFESACDILDKYSNQLIAVVTDLQFPKNSTLTPDAGLELLKRIHAYEPHMPVIVQSRQIEARALVDAANGTFLWKDSPRLITELKEFLSTYCGFGPFVFRWPDGTEWARANTIDGLHALIAGAPQTVFEYHASHNDFSAWLGVHGFVALAAQVRRIHNTGKEGKMILLEILETMPVKEA